MKLFTPLRPDPRAPLAAANPVAKLGAALVLMAVLFVSVDAVTASVILLGTVAAVFLSGLSARSLLGRTWPILLTALSVGILNTVLAAPRPAPQLDIGPVSVSADSAWRARRISSRANCSALSNSSAESFSRASNCGQSAWGWPLSVVRRSSVCQPS